MNTKEINGSNWRLKYYPISAIPLAIVTVLLPLIILPAINFASRHLAAHKMLRNILHWSWILTTLSLALVVDIAVLIFRFEQKDFSVGLHYFSFIGLWGLMGAMSLIFLVYAYNFFRGLSRCWNNKTERQAYWKAKKWWFGFWWFAAACWTANWVLGDFWVVGPTVPFLEITPYLIYFGYVWWRWRKRVAKEKAL